MRNTEKDISIRYDIEQQQTLLFESHQLPLSMDEWSRLSKIVSNSEYQHVIGGDSNESHSVWVSRYHNDVEAPQALSEFSDEVESIIMSEKMREFYRQFTGTEALCLRRCQANVLNAGDYIGEHCDQDSSPEYLATVVFHFDSEYQGGYFETLDNTVVGRSYKPAPFTALVNNCRVPHRVSSVTRGSRVTLACFLSRSFQINTHQPAEFKIDDSRQFG